MISLEALKQERDSITARIAGSLATHQTLVTQFAERLKSLEERITAGDAAAALEAAAAAARAQKLADVAAKRAAQNPAPSEQPAEAPAPTQPAQS